MRVRILVGLPVVLLMGCGAASNEPEGVAAAGSVTSGSGGASNSASGGVSTGGVSNPATGGESAGGTSNAATGGTTPTGGSGSDTGGTAPTGGRSFGGRGGSTASGGVGVGGTTATGGRGSDTGGTSAAGGTSGGGEGTGGVTITSDCTDADRTLTSNSTGQHCGYTYEYWKDQGTGTLVLKPDGFSVEWSNINNLLGRKGVRPGSADLVVTFEANYQPNGNSYLSIYGWTKNPLVEYYIVDSWGSWRPPGGGAKGTVTSDGGSYDIYQTQRVNQPSIEGTKTFAQYWSVRKEKRTSGVITVGNHFSAWEAAGMNMGSMYEVSMNVEGYQSSGKADVKMSME